MVEDLYPVRFAMDKLFAEGAPYSPREIVVVLAVVRHMNKETRSGFPGYDRISRQTRVSVRDIGRILAEHCNNSPKPLLARGFRGHKKSYTYELVLNPEEFAKVRDAQPKRPKRARKAHRRAINAKGKPLLNLPSRPSLIQRRGVPRPDLVECRCGASIARWPDGTAMNMVGAIVTTEPHQCTAADMPIRPTNTCATESTDRTNGPTNTCEPPSRETEAITRCS